LRAAQFQAQKEAFETLIFRTGLQGEASVIGREIATQLGETTVTLKGNGKGGRNQDLALAAVDVLSGLKDVMLISLATDGEDGSTDAAGESAQRAGMLGLTAPAHLLRNDAYSYFASLGDLIRTGASGTNINDLVICFAFNFMKLMPPCQRCDCSTLCDLCRCQIKSQLVFCVKSVFRTRVNNKKGHHC